MSHLGMGDLPLATYVLVHGGAHGSGRTRRWRDYSARGRMVITGAAHCAERRVSHLVYFDAANPTDGQSLSEADGGRISQSRRQGAVINGVESVLLPTTRSAASYDVPDPDDRAWVDERLTPYPWRCFAQKLLRRNRPGIIARAVRLWQVDTGHDLMITEPQAVAGALLAVAEDQV